MKQHSDIDSANFVPIKISNFLYDEIEKEKVESILDLVDVIFLLTDSEDKIRMVNDKTCMVLGYQKEELINKYFPDFIAENNKNRWKSDISLENNIKTEEIESDFITKSGEKRIINLHLRYLPDDSGKISFIICSGQDVTEKRKDEKVQKIISEILEAGNSEKNLDELFKFIHHSISKLMPAKNFYIALYEPSEDMISFPYFIDEVDKEAPDMKFGKGLTEYVIATGKSILVDSEKDEELIAKGEVELIGSRAAIWLGTPLKIQEKTIGVFAVQDYQNKNTYTERDREILDFISFPLSRAIERKKVEQEKNNLIEKLKELNDSKDKLFSLISHDLRSPFNSLLGFSEILTTEYESLTHDEIREYLNVIYETSKNLYGMTNNLLQFSRFQMNRIEFNPVKLNVKKIIDTNLNMLKGNAIKKQLNLLTEIDPKAEVFADEEMLNSIMQNLISNAIKFTNKGGDIKVNARIINFFNKPDHVEIIVEDTGIGVPKDKISKIFKEHVQSSPGTEREYGTGLGLLLVKEFVEKNRGSIKIKSKLYQGTTFTFILPVAS